MSDLSKKAEIPGDDGGMSLHEESFNPEIDYICFENMATVYRDDEEHILIAVNSETSGPGIAYFKVYNHESWDNATAIARLHFKDNRLEYHEGDKKAIPVWSTPDDKIKKVIEILSSPLEDDLDHTYWQFACYQWNYENNLIPPNSMQKYLNGDYDSRYTDGDIRAKTYVPSTQPMPEGWVYNPPDDEPLHEDSEEQSASSEAFFEMAGRLPRDSSGRCSLVVAVGAKEKNIAHFHVFRTEEDKEAWIGGACLFFTENRYYDHARNQETLTKDEMRDLIRLLTSPYKRDKRITNWQQLVYLWNDNNERYEIPDDTPMPIYDCNTITRYTE